MDEINPLPYLITFAILFLILIGVFTWALAVWYKEFQCGANPNIWCNDDWTCTRTCTVEPVNSCFTQNNPTGLASCLYGPQSAAATLCYTLPDGDQPTTPACNCPVAMTTTSSCYSGCPLGLADINQTNVCCCKTNDPGCLPESMCKPQPS